MHRVELRPAAQRDIRRLPRDIQERIRAAILPLSQCPRPSGCKKLSDRQEWRIRVADYRILYTIDDALLLVEVVKVAPRNSAYSR